MECAMRAADTHTQNILLLWLRSEEFTKFLDFSWVLFSWALVENISFFGLVYFYFFPSSSFSSFERIFYFLLSLGFILLPARYFGLVLFFTSFRFDPSSVVWLLHLFFVVVVPFQFGSSPSHTWYFYAALCFVPSANDQNKAEKRKLKPNQHTKVERTDSSLFSVMLCICVLYSIIFFFWVSCGVPSFIAF